MAKKGGWLPGLAVLVAGIAALAVWALRAPAPAVGPLAVEGSGREPGERAPGADPTSAPPAGSPVPDAAADARRSIVGDEAGPAAATVEEAVLPWDTVVRGRVLEADGRPVREFRLRASLVGRETSASWRFEDAEGRFRIELGPGDWTLWVMVHGTRGPTASIAGLPRAVEELELRLKTDLVDLTGTVVSPEGDPVGTASVISAGTQVTTDAGGRFATRVPPGRVRLRAEAEGYSSVGRAEVEVGPLGRRGVVVEVQPHGRIEGVVLDVHGAPEGGVGVRASALGGGWNPPGVESDAAGRFALEALPSAEYLVIATASDRTSELRIRHVTVRAGETATIELGGKGDRPITISGKVLLGGRPLEGGGEVVAFPRGADPFASLSRSPISPVGTWRLQVATPGAFEFLLSPWGAETAASTRVEVPDVPHWNLDLEVPAASIAGRVFDGEGAPVSGALLRLLGEGVSNPVVAEMGMRGRTNEEGEFEFRFLEPGSYRLQVEQAPGDLQRGVVATLDVVRDRALENIEVRLLGSVSLEGVVAGLAFGERAVVFARGGDGQWFNPHSSVSTDGEGRFEIEGLRPGRYLLQAFTRDRASSESEIVGTGDARGPIRLELRRSTRLYLSLVDGNGDPLAASFSVRDSRGFEHADRSSGLDLEEFLGSGMPDRESRVGPLLPGSYAVRATAPDGRSAVRSIVAGPGDQRVVLKLGE